MFLKINVIYRQPSKCHQNALTISYYKYIFYAGIYNLIAMAVLFQGRSQYSIPIWRLLLQAGLLYLAFR